MSGQGAYFSVANCTTSQAAINAAAVTGMNKVPNTSTLPAGTCDAGQYAEAASFGTSSFQLVISLSGQLIQLGFNVASGKYWVNDGASALVSAPGIKVSVVIAQQGGGSQDMVNIIIYPS
ncbi:MAG TPA: hypothetical protein VK539_02810 [Myxococcaceae bacterium]|nr:hypothetical protein [Myxococcaceae bacterium]